MAFSSTSYLAPQFQSYKFNWIKFYDTGTTTPKSIATDSTGGTLIAKAEVNSQGFFETAGGTVFIPFVDGFYDAYLFPTEAEADANDTSNAIKVADNIINDAQNSTDILRGDLADGTAIAGNTVAKYAALEFNTVADMISGLTRSGEVIIMTALPAGTAVRWLGYYAVNDGGDNLGVITAGAHTADGGSIFTINASVYVAANLKGGVISVRKFGAYGNFGSGDNDDTLAINTCLSYADTNDNSVIFPPGKYVVSNTLTVQVDTVFDGGAFLHPVGMPASAAVYDIITRTKHSGVYIIGDAGVDPANGTIGIRVVGTLISSSRVQLEKCKVLRCNYGILIGTFSVMVTNCSAVSSNTNLGMYAPATNQEINDINIIGGVYADPLGDYAVDIGIDALSPIAKGQPQGTRILLQGFALDSGTLRINGVDNITADNLYFEFTTTGKCIELGHVGFDGGVNVVTVKNCRFKSTDYGVYCFSGVRDLEMKQSNYSGISTTALYLSTDIYDYNYKGGYNAGSFNDGQEVHTGVRGGDSYQFSGQKSINIYEMAGGASVGAGNTNHIYRGRSDEDVSVTLNYQNFSTANSRGRNFIPGTGATKTGTVAGNVITFATQADVQVFNGGDSVSVGGTASQIKSVDYDAKTVLMRSNTYPQGSQSIVQQEITPRLSGLSTAIPTRTDGFAGSVLHSRNAGQTGWIYQGGAWVSF